MEALTEVVASSLRKNHSSALTIRGSAPTVGRRGESTLGAPANIRLFGETLLRLRAQLHDPQRHEDQRVALPVCLSALGTDKCSPAEICAAAGLTHAFREVRAD